MFKNKMADALKSAGLKGTPKKKVEPKRKPTHHKKIKSKGSRKNKRKGNNTGLAAAVPRPRQKPFSPSLATPEAAYGCYGPAQEKAVKISPAPKTTYLKIRSDIEFKPSSVFDEKVADYGVQVIKEKPIFSLIGSSHEDEVQLVIGLDLGTSTTKVVIGDPDNKRFFAVPFSHNSDNPYLISTAVSLSDARDVKITNSDSLTRSDLKIRLMKDEDLEIALLLSGYIAQIIRFSIRWFMRDHADEYEGYSIFWTMAMGVPTDSTRQQDLEARFRQVAITGAQAALAKNLSINLAELKTIYAAVQEDIEKSKNGESRFDVLGSDEGVVTVTPEVAAQMYGLFRSQRWDRKQPISFLMDIGAGTVDAAVFSLLNASSQGKDMRISMFSCKVSDLGAFNLHLSRVKWLHDNLPDDLVGKARTDTESYLRWLKKRNPSTLTVPKSINQYLNNLDLNKHELNKDPDSEYSGRLLGNSVTKEVLMAARNGGFIKKYDICWNELRTVICGGGSRSKLYVDFLDKIANDTSDFNLKVQELEHPEKLKAPGLAAQDYDRLSVAFGLAHGPQIDCQWADELGLERL